METTQASLDHLTWENPTGEARKDALRLDFDRRLKLEFHGTKITNDTGFLLEPGDAKNCRKTRFSDGDNG